MDGFSVSISSAYKFSAQAVNASHVKNILQNIYDDEECILQLCCSLHGGVGGCCDGFMGGAGSGGGDMQSNGADGAMRTTICNGNTANSVVLYEDEGPTELHV